jgi:hypothetical protein
MPIKFLNDVAVDSSVLYVDTINNRVGIGTTSPQSLDGFIIGIGATEHGVIWNYEEKDLIFGTAATERLRIKSNGNVGIGTTSPSYVLDVVGEGNFSSYVNVNSATGIRTSSGWIHLSRFGDTNQNVAIGNNGTDVDLYVPNGRVGIGTTSPSAELHILQGGGATVKLGTSLNTSHIEAREVGTANALVLSANGSTNQLALINGGNVGIGTASPSAKLHIEGDGSIIRLQNNSSDANGTFIDFCFCLLKGPSRFGFTQMPQSVCILTPQAT